MYKGPHHARVEVFSRQLSFSFECGFLRTRFLFKICVLTFNQFYLSFTYKFVLSHLPLSLSLSLSLYLPNSQKFTQSQSHTLSFSLTNTPTHPPTLLSNTDSLFKSIILSLSLALSISPLTQQCHSLFFSQMHNCSHALLPTSQWQQNLPLTCSFSSFSQQTTSSVFLLSLPYTDSHPLSLSWDRINRC